MAGNIKIGGNTIFTHTGAVGAGTVTLKDQSGNAILTDDGTAVSMGNLRLPATGGIKDSSGNNILTESGGVVSAGPSLALGTTSNPLTKNIVMGSGYGLDFSAAAGSAAGSSSAVLDDYEEGTFSPSLGVGAASGTATGRYVKVGNLVSIFVYIQAITNTSSGSLFEVTMPFTASNVLNSYSGSVMCRYLSYYSDSKDVVSYIDGNSTDLRLYFLNDGVTYTGVAHVDFASNSNIGLRLNINIYVD